LLYTDGLSDSAEGTVYELDHAVGVLNWGSTRSPEEIVRAVLDDRASKGNGTPSSDDLTVMAIRRS
jgi:serine phosphatase RsbU (regulator of sigma subunit)